MNTKLNEVLEKSKSLSDIARELFGKQNYTNREKCKQILKENGIEWKKWLEDKKTKPKRYCLNCGKEIVDGDYRKKFCNSSCATSYNNRGISRHKTTVKKINKCLNCGKEIPCNRKYCNNVCQGDYEYKDYISKWKNGERNGISGIDYISRHIVRYMREKYGDACQICGWNIKNQHTNRVPLQIHHIDGDCKNNKEENLQLLCPNCHSLTETFGALNRGNSTRKDKRIR